MKRAARLQPVLQRLLEAERQARQRLVACETDWATQRARLADLHRYAGEYRQRTQVGAVPVATLRDHQQFVGRLEHLALNQERESFWSDVVRTVPDHLYVQDVLQGFDHATSVAGLDALFAGAGA